MQILIGVVIGIAVLLGVAYLSIRAGDRPTRRRRDANFHESGAGLYGAGTDTFDASHHSSDVHGGSSTDSHSGGSADSF